MERDEGVRIACFSRLAVLQAQFGDELPYNGGLDQKFPYRGDRVPFLNRQKGIYRAGVQRGPAALSIQTSYRSPYGDTVTDDGVRYAYRAGDIDGSDNRALRTAHLLGVPIVYFFATWKGRYQPFYPCFVTEDDPANRQVFVSKGKMAGPMDDPEPVLLEDPIERRYANREVKVRMHQGRFRGLVLPAYREQCTICRLREVLLLDAAHIVGDAESAGGPEVTNGLSLCTIHHRAFDQDLVGISPDYKVHLSRRLLDEQDGPMLDVLKGFQGTTIELPKRLAWHPDRERLAVRFDRFRQEP